MADTKITALAAITTVDPAADVLPIVDISDTSMAASGTTKKITTNQILGSGGTATLASATITGDLTVDTSTLKVDSTNNRVGIGTASPTVALDVNATQVKLTNNATADCTVLVGPDTPTATRSGRIGLVTSSTEKSWFIASNWNIPGGFEITQSTAAGGSTISSNPTLRINNNSDFLFLDGAGGTRMTLNSTGLGVGVTPAAGDGSGVFKAAGIGSLTANSRVGLDVRELVSGNSAGIILGAMTTENTGVIGTRTGSGNIAFQTYNGSAWGERARIDYLGNLILTSPSTPPTLAANGQLTVNATSNTNLRFSFRGSDGTTRVANITLA